MEDVDLQKKEKEEVKPEVKQEEEKKGYYLAKIATAFGTVIALDGKEILAEELIVKMANSLKEAGLMK